MTDSIQLSQVVLEFLFGERGLGWIGKIRACACFGPAGCRLSLVAWACVGLRGRLGAALNGEA